ncbi:uncharacterized protein SAPINGB_P005060 [Magnusiomyces paraingens]|uniref:Dolichol phosphate-mannose biosynthesis regulatory protein n=1 Tax=Magnusiomyces paraingens TaxID=2606893 RepID=A0A5E8BZB4_9ASCO|nr:uncharacterized protein SAPINGB_P005060 [Saprochaete ingens]VVT56442.1 unnamed protein product [Saprochaete ingens]
MSFDKLIGAAMIFVATAVFIYYTIWTFVLPFVDESSPIQSLFLPREWAIRIPVVLLLTAVAGVGTFIGKVLIKNAEKEKRKQAAAKAK